MTTPTPFFPDKKTFLTWAQSIPGIFPCREDPHIADPKDLCYPNTEGPYFASPEYLLLRVGSSTGTRYNVLVRVHTEAEADYRWHIPASHPDQDGETIFAAYQWDHHAKPAKIVGGATLREARQALDTFLATQSGRRTFTRLL